MVNFAAAASRLQDRLEELLCYISALAVAVMMTITTLEVIVRGAFYTSVPGSYEYVSLLFVYLIFLGLAFHSAATHTSQSVLCMTVYPVKPGKLSKGFSCW